jgi:hypothetical protein
MKKRFFLRLLRRDIQKNHLFLFYSFSYVFFLLNCFALLHERNKIKY